MRWYVCDMDDGVLRVESSRRDAVEWWKCDQIATDVIERHTYGPGFYDYLVGDSREDAARAAIVCEDKLPRYGITTPPSQIQPLYPCKDRPHEAREALVCS
ncbi:hypothetical protein [Amycolatopsis sp. PS_44_ISF1]|uniref:hypothetical protein n=1 Tax=Amycolatopsis sp. PS_44_ISF1 TaxID=2974917 RepID=UPI0028DFDDF2|nr:hypothetical protein [Amycolatopsis sp. PS_44_ISF1]MDT8913522.1 hypothetical protein [Amycolatopsis sp. PS_44_ISF1]